MSNDYDWPFFYINTFFFLRLVLLLFFSFVELFNALFSCCVLSNKVYWCAGFLNYVIVMPKTSRPLDSIANRVVNRVTIPLGDQVNKIFTLYDIYAMAFRLLCSVVSISFIRFFLILSYIFFLLLLLSLMPVYYAKHDNSLALLDLFAVLISPKGFLKTWFHSHTTVTTTATTKKHSRYL